MEHGFCSLSLGNGYSISIENLCRYVGQNGEFFSSQDHGQMFGLAEPYDAEEKIGKAIRGKLIQEVRLSEDTGDLTLVFDRGRFEIICTSAGYECYGINGLDDQIIVVRGGNK